MSFAIRHTLCVVVRIADLRTTRTTEAVDAFLSLSRMQKVEQVNECNRFRTYLLSWMFPILVRHSTIVKGPP